MIMASRVWRDILRINKACDVLGRWNHRNPPLLEGRCDIHSKTCDIGPRLRGVTDLTGLDEEQMRAQPIAPPRIILNHVVIG